MFKSGRGAGAAHALAALGLVVFVLLSCKSSEGDKPLPDVVEAGEPEQPPTPAQAVTAEQAQDAGQEQAPDAGDEVKKPATPVWRPRDAGADAAPQRDAGQATVDAGAALDAGAAVACAKNCQKKLRKCQTDQRAGRRPDGAPSCAQDLVNCMAGCR
jgi:hypothetical protein